VFGNQRIFEFTVFDIHKEWIDDVRAGNEDLPFDVIGHSPLEVEDGLRRLAVQKQSFASDDFPGSLLWADTRRSAAGLYVRNAARSCRPA
jgi:hypothetical protein